MNSTTLNECKLAYFIRMHVIQEVLSPTNVQIVIKYCFQPFFGGIDQLRCKEFVARVSIGEVSVPDLTQIHGEHINDNIACIAIRAPNNSS